MSKNWTNSTHHAELSIPYGELWWQCHNVGVLFFNMWREAALQLMGRRMEQNTKEENLMEAEKH